MVTPFPSDFHTKIGLFLGVAEHGVRFVRPGSASLRNGKLLRSAVVIGIPEYSFLPEPVMQQIAPLISCRMMFYYSAMKKYTDRMIEHIKALKNMNRAELAKEAGELAYHTRKVLFSQIPGVSAIAGLLAGSWVAGTFTSSPVKGFLSSVGLMKGGTHVVSSTTYRFLSVVLPILAVALTAYAVQKVMKTYREKQLKRNMGYIPLLKEEVQAELKAKMDILDKAREAGLLSESEHRTKMAALYQSYFKSDLTRIEEIIIRKIEG